MTPEYTPMDPALEQAVAEIRDEAVDTAVMEAAAARVWLRLSEAAAAHGPSPVIRNCADFQALIPEFRAGRLSEARTMLLQDHLHQCVACRHIFEGKVTVMPAVRPTVRRTGHAARWAMAATVLLAAGVTVWWYVDQYGQRTGPAIVQSLDGSLFAVTAEGIRPLKMGQDLPAGVELRTAEASDAVLKLSDGSQVEMRERSSLSTTAAGTDLTVHLGRGSVIVEAAHRRKGHLYVDTPDCRVAVTGTLFGVTAGVKGSRVSVVQGEVHVTQDNQEKILHAGDQSVTSTSVEPEPVGTEIAWSRNHANLLKQLNLLRAGLAQARIPALRYSSSLLGRLPAHTALYVSIPNLAEYLKDAESVLGKEMAGNPQVRALWNSRLGAILDLLRAGSEYLGDEIDIVGGAGQAPVLVALERHQGLEEFLRTTGVPLKVVNHAGVLVFGPDAKAVEAAAEQIDSGFASQPLYARIAESYRQGAGLLMWADLANGQTPIQGARYFFAEEKQTGGHMVGSAALGFDGPRTGIAAQLAEPSPMGSLDYVSPDATALLGFVVKDPGAIVDLALSVTQGSLSAAQQTLADERQEKGFDVRDGLASSLGGEFTVAMDGPLMPVPSWKLVSEVYDPNRFQATLEAFVDRHNQQMAQTGKKPLRTAQENFEGRTYYTIAAVDSGPLLEAHYTFDQGYLIAAPTRALVYNALRIKTAGTSIKHSTRFLELTPRDQHVNFSVVIYQNLGNSMAPLAMLAGAFAPPGAAGRGNLLQGLSNVKPALYAVYGEPDCITMTANGDVLGSTLASLLSGNLLGVTGLPLPMGQMMGTRAPHASYAGR